MLEASVSSAGLRGEVLPLSLLDPPPGDVLAGVGVAGESGERGESAEDTEAFMLSMSPSLTGRAASDDAVEWSGDASTVKLLRLL